MIFCFRFKIYTKRRLDNMVFWLCFKTFTKRILDIVKAIFWFYFKIYHPSLLFLRGETICFCISVFFWSSLLQSNQIPLAFRPTTRVFAI